MSDADDEGDREEKDILEEELKRSTERNVYGAIKGVNCRDYEEGDSRIESPNIRACSRLSRGSDFMGQVAKK